MAKDLPQRVNAIDIDVEHRPLDVKLFQVNATVDAVASILEEIVADGEGESVSKVFICAQALRGAFKQLEDMWPELRRVIAGAPITETRVEGT